MRDLVMGGLAMRGLVMRGLVMRGLVNVFSLLLLTSCTASINEAAKASIDRQVAQLSNAGAAYAPPTENVPLPIAAGQWIKQHMTDKDGKHSFVTTKLLSAEGERVWLETETESYYGATALKMLVSLGDGKDPGTIDVHEYWLKHEDGRVEQFPPFLLASVKPSVRQVLVGTTIVNTPEGQVDVTTPAGQFQQAYRARVTVNVMGRALVSDAWWHPAVPLGGGVRSVGQDPANKVELVAFGTSGARSVFP